jgi:hypothetical protein
MEFLYRKFLSINQVVFRNWSIILEDVVIYLGPFGILLTRLHLGDPGGASSTLGMRGLLQVFLVRVFLLGVFLIELIQDLALFFIWGLAFTVTLKNPLLLLLLALKLHSLVGHQIHVLILDVFS